MDIHPLTNHDIANARAGETARRARVGEHSLVREQKRSIVNAFSFARRIRRRRAVAAAQIRAT
jgi:hypothetical protein